MSFTVSKELMFKPKQKASVAEFETTSKTSSTVE